MVEPPELSLHTCKSSIRALDTALEKSISTKKVKKEYELYLEYPHKQFPREQKSQKKFYDPETDDEERTQIDAMSQVLQLVGYRGRPATAKKYLDAEHNDFLRQLMLEPTPTRRFFIFFTQSSTEVITASQAALKKIGHKWKKNPKAGF